MTTPDTQTPGAPRSPEFEARARALLTRYAEEMPASAATAARVREALAAPSSEGAAARTRTDWRPSRLGGPHGSWALGAVSLGLVAALLVGFIGVTWLLNSQGQRHGTAPGPCTEILGQGQDGTVNLCPPPTPVKATIQVKQSYADATRTAIQLQFTTPGALIPHGRPVVYSRPNEVIPFGETLRDTQGHVYGLAGLGLGPFPYAAGQDVATGADEFNPLPEVALSGPQTLTLRIEKLSLLYQQQFVVVLTGPWEVTFQANPHAGRSITFHVAPQTHNGVTMQPLRLDIAPSASVFDNYGANVFTNYGNGGARLTLRISGLRPGTNLIALHSFYAEGQMPGGGGWSSGGPGKALFEGRSPAYVVLDSGDPNAVVGPAGTATIQLIYAAPPLSESSGTQELIIDEIATASTYPNPPVIEGPWTFALELG